MASPRVVLLMGVSGSGKTTVGRAFADATRRRFVDADDLHPPTNREKMARGKPLDDADRGPWLDAVRRQIEAALTDRGDEGLVVCCSALKRRYRDRLRRPGEPILVALLDADRASLLARLMARTGHFFPPTLLDSQLRTLERPTPDESPLMLDATRPVDELVATLVDAASAIR